MIFEMSKLRQRGILTSFSLKCIALSCMLIDHTAYVLVRISRFISSCGLSAGFPSRSFAF